MSANVSIHEKTVGSSAIATPESSVSARGTAYHASHVQNEATPNRTLPDPQERVDIERDRSERRGKAVTPPSRDHRSGEYSREGEGAKIRDEVRQQDSLK